MGDAQKTPPKSRKSGKCLKWDKNSYVSQALDRSLSIPTRLLSEPLQLAEADFIIALLYT